MLSKNFKNKTWYVEDEGSAINPYEQLDPRFAEDSINKRIRAIQDQEGESFQLDVADGAAAVIAFDKLQSSDLQIKQRQDLASKLKRYCELDTLAMVMCYQALLDRLE